MKELPTLEKLRDAFSRLPGIGVKSAERMAYSVLSWDDERRNSLIDALSSISNNIHKCPICGLYTENPSECDYCLDENRDHSSLCVVSENKDALAIERMHTFSGVYHVLGGYINASKGVGIDSLRIDELVKRVEEGKIKEVILATDPTLEGETTALFIAKLLEGKAEVTRLGYGLPMGASLDYADSLTLSKAFEGRKKI